MYTQVSFGNFLARIMENVERERGIKFDEYPNVPIRWSDGEWLYEICNDLSVRVFRWPRKSEVLIAGPYRDIPPAENQNKFEARFEREFKAAVDQRMDHL